MPFLPTDPSGMATTRLITHSRWWKWQFRKEKLLLRLKLRNAFLDIEHVGSTAVPGLIAKPIIDIVATVPNLDVAFELVSRIERMGYEYKGQSDKPEHYFFVKGDPIRFHLFLYEGADPWCRAAFRDALRRNPELAVEYAVVKKILAARYPDDRHAYWNGKREFIDGVVQR